MSTVGKGVIRKYITVFLVITTLASVGSVFLVHPERALTSDSIEYIGLSENLYRFHDFLSFYHDSEPELYRTPGYPLFLLGFKPWESMTRLRVLIASQIFILMLAAIVLVKTARLFGFVKVWLLYALIILNPVVVLYASCVLSECIFVLFCVLASWGFCKSLVSKRLSYLGISGMFAGLATIVRPIGIFQIVLITLILLVFGKLLYPQRRLLTIIGVWSLCSLFIPGVWASHNGIRYKYWGISKTCLSFASSVYGTGQLDAERGTIKNSVSDHECDMRDAISDISNTIKKHPGRTVKYFVKGAAYVLLGPGEWAMRRGFLGETGSRAGAGPAACYSISETPTGLRFQEIEVTRGGQRRGPAAVALMAWSWLLLTVTYLWVVICLAGMFRRGRWISLIFLAIAAGYLFSSCGYQGNSRFRMPIIPHILLFCAISTTKRRIPNNNDPLNPDYVRVDV